MGLTISQVAAERVSSPKTVQSHIGQIYSRYDIRGRHELMAFALLRGLLPITDIFVEALKWRLKVQRAILDESPTQSTMQSTMQGTVQSTMQGTVQGTVRNRTTSLNHVSSTLGASGLGDH